MGLLTAAAAGRSKFYRHERGFTHQKVVVVDDDLAAVGSANFDNRSFRLIFELTIEIRDPDFATQMAGMLESDFADSRLVAEGELGFSTASRYAP